MFLRSLQLHSFLSALHLFWEKKKERQKFISISQQTFCSDFEASTFADAEPKTVFRQALKPKKS
jgi:hypothetical protein